MPLSSFTDFTPVAERSEATPGSINARLRQVSDNVISLYSSVQSSLVSIGGLSSNTIQPESGNTVRVPNGKDLIVRSIDSGGAVYNVKAFGAVGNNSADDAPSINSAILHCIAAGGGTVYLPEGRYRTASTVTIAVSDPPMTVRLLGDWASSVIVPTSAVSTALAVASSSTDATILSRVLVQGLQLDGVSTGQGAVGIRVGNALALSGVSYSTYLTFRDVSAYSFRATGSYGLLVEDVVGGLWDNCYFGGNANNCLIDAASGDLPTVITFNKTHFRSAVSDGVVIRQGFGIRFSRCVIEANTKYGVIAVPTGSDNLITLEIDGCWFEGNFPADTSKFQAHFDGTNAGTAMVRVANTYFAGVAKSLYYKEVRNAVIDDVYPSNVAGAVTVDTGCQGKLLNWPHNNLAFATRFTNSSSTDFRATEDIWHGKVIVNSSGNLIPLGDATYDIGASALRFGVGHFSRGQFGTTPSTGGVIGLPHQGTISWRNAANSANIDALHLTTDKLLASLVSLDVTGDVTATMRVIANRGQFGTNPSTGGVVGLPHQGAISWRNAANSANVDALYLSSDKLLASLVTIDVTGDLVLAGVAASKIVPGATSLSLRNAANNADNLLVTDAGAVASRDTFRATQVWATSGISVGVGGTVLPAMSSMSSKIGAFVVAGSASSFTHVTWAAVQPGDLIQVTVMPDGAASSISSGLVPHSHCTTAGRFEFRLSNVSTLEQNQSSKTWFFVRTSPF